MRSIYLVRSNFAGGVTPGTGATVIRQAGLWEALGMDHRWLFGRVGATESAAFSAMGLSISVDHAGDSHAAYATSVPVGPRVNHFHLPVFSME